MERGRRVRVYRGEALARYSFEEGHPFGAKRLSAFWGRAVERGLDRNVDDCEPCSADQQAIERFHTHQYVERVKARSEDGIGFLDYGDTPAFCGVFEAASCVVGTALDAAARIVGGGVPRVFIPIGGLHHARRDGAGGFCVFNDIGVVIETLRAVHGVRRVAYVDIDAHHGDGVYYSFVEDSELFIADIHEDGRFLYPGTGAADEAGTGEATGTKLNLPLLPLSGDTAFRRAWDEAEAFIRAARPEFIIFQCGADGLAGDPITHLAYTSGSFRYATERLVGLADELCDGRILALGGGGYDLQNIADAWTVVVEALCATPPQPLDVDEQSF